MDGAEKAGGLTVDQEVGGSSPPSCTSNINVLAKIAI